MTSTVGVEVIMMGFLFLLLVTSHFDRDRHINIQLTIQRHEQSTEKSQGRIRRRGHKKELSSNEVVTNREVYSRYTVKCEARFFSE